MIHQLEVVTSFKSRNNPVKKYANDHEIAVHSWEEVRNDHRICGKFDFGLVVSFGHMIPESMIKSFKKSMLNVHASLLPKYRGASPIIYAIKNHESITGVTIMKIEARKFDVGDILAKKEVTIGKDILMPELHDNLANIGAKLLIECLKNYENIQPVKQDNSCASYAPKIDHEFCKIHWNSMTSTQVYDLYRSLYSFKHIITTFRKEPVKILELIRPTDTQNDPQLPGFVRFCWKTKRLLVRCSDQKDVEVVRLSIGKKVMSAADFNNGFLRKHVDKLNLFE